MGGPIGMGGAGGSYSGGGVGPMGGPTMMAGATRGGIGPVGGGRVVYNGGSGDCCGSPVHVTSRSTGTGVYGTGGSYMGGGPGGGMAIEPTPGCGLGSGLNDTACCVGGPETQCGGVGSACFDSAGNMVTTSDFSYVGEGRGGYSVIPNYNYVGEGAGSYTKDVIVTPYGCRIRPCCLLLGLLALLLPLLYYLLQPTCGGTFCNMFPALCTDCQIQPPVGPLGECTLWGDPHIRTFDHIRSDYYSPGEFWVVKSKYVWIQARYLQQR